MEKGSKIISPRQLQQLKQYVSRNKSNGGRQTGGGKQAAGLFGSIWQYPNWGKYRPRYYVLGDSSQGLDTLSRQYLTMWSREMAFQLPFVGAAVKALADFSIGEAYLPEYNGENKEWWKYANEWLIESFYPNACTKGQNYDFQTCLHIESRLIDIDGDYLVVYGEDPDTDMPQFQIIQNNRIRKNTEDNIIIGEGPYKGLIFSDGVYYTPAGKPVYYNIQNAGNLINNLASQTPDIIVSTRDAHLVYDPCFIDKARGVPSIGSAILQALSIQELDQYLMEKAKIQATLIYIEKTPSGEAPVELQDTLEALLAETGASAGVVNVAPNTHAVDIKQGGEIRYISAEGGDITSFADRTAGTETQDYMARLEMQILSTIGVPHQIVYSTDKVSGRITTGIAEMFRAAISRRQKIMDKRAKFCVAWALAKAMDKGFIPRNDDENIYSTLNFTHPHKFTLDAKYDSQIVISEYEAGMGTLNDATTTLYNKTAEATLEEQKKEQILFYNKAKEVSDVTGVPLDTIISGWKFNQKVTTTNAKPTDDIQNNESKVDTKIEENE